MKVLHSFLKAVCLWDDSIVQRNSLDKQRIEGPGHFYMKQPRVEVEAGLSAGWLWGSKQLNTIEMSINSTKLYKTLLLMGDEQNRQKHQEEQVGIKIVGSTLLTYETESK